MRPCDGIDHSVDDDRDMLRELVRIYGKTNGFETPQTMTYGGERIRVPHSVFGAFRKELDRIVSMHGIGWASAMTGARFVPAVQSGND